ncbi:MAG: thioredoxin domain-containing protein [Acidobacteria bacterium]|nr:thioredoxin domain-containing protein [Acidobacteriota bacterium]
MKMIRHADAHLIAKHLTTLNSSGSGKRRRLQTGLPRIAGAGLWLFVCAGFIPGAWQSAAAQTGEQKPVATVGGEALYEEDFLPQIQGQVYKIRKQEYDLKRKALEDVINKKLMRAEAQKQGITEQEWLRQEVDSKVPDPTNAEVEQTYVNQMARINRPINMVIDQIRQQLKQANLVQAREEFFRGLRERAGVKIYLQPPRIEVGYDPARVRGNPGAVITIVEFSDFQCPFCLRAYMTIKGILAKYDGKVKLAYRDLPLQPIQPGAHGSAEASRCAGAQGKFWEYHDLLFENQDFFGDDEFREYAEILQLDTKQFTTCLESGKFQSQIQEDFQEGVRMGITGTPFFYINGIPVNGAQPAAVFEEIIEAELAAIEQ